MALGVLSVVLAAQSPVEKQIAILELRGPGEVLGTRQTGMLQFRVADLARDQHLLEQIPPVANRLLEENPELAEKLVRRWIGDSTRFAVV